MLGIRSGFVALLAAATALCTWGQPSSGQTQPKPGTVVMIPKKLEGGSQFALKVSPFVDMRFFVRAVNTGRAQAPAIEGFDRALAADKTVMETLPGLASGVFESDFLTCPDAAEAQRRAATLPENASFPGIKLVNLKKLGVELTEALAAIEPAYLATVWPEHQKSLDDARATLEATVIAKQRACLDSLLAGLGLTDPKTEIGVYLITAGPAPGAYTFRVGNGTACVIAINAGAADEPALRAMDLAETVLYQSTYALNTGVPSPSAAPTALRKAIKDAALPAGDCGTRELLRAVLYANAHAAVRKVLDSNHEPVADSRGLFKDCPRAWSSARSTWDRVAAGELAPEAAAKAAVAAYVEKKPAEAPSEVTPIPAAK